MTSTSDAPTTPQTKSPPLCPDTPILRPVPQSDDGTGGPGIVAVTRRHETCLQVPYATLLRSALGSPPEPHEISQIRKKLTEEGVLSAVQSTLPSQSNLLEAEAYEPLGNMISSILRQVPDCPFSFLAEPSAAPLCRGNTPHPDACIVLGPPGTSERHWHEIAIPFELDNFEDEGETEYDNRVNMIWNFHNIMREDPLRRFTLGITVEDTTMRVCYSNRAFLAVSEPVDFIQEINQVISLFYLIGRKREVDLGWDPTVERINDNTYKFTIDGQHYTAKYPLVTHGADDMIGHGARVYLAQDKDGNEVAIKDFWRVQGHESEGTILNKIFHDIQAKFGEEASNVEKYFVKILVCEDVLISGSLDRTLTLENEEDVRWTSVEACRLPTERCLPSRGHVPLIDIDIQSADMQHVSYQSDTVLCRIHSRTVFKDAGRPLRDINLLADSFSCLSDVRKALYYLHKAGWLHCNINVTNALWVEEDGRYIGKLTDFEYAKKVDFNTSRDVRMGATCFMALEVEHQSYLFPPPERPLISVHPFRMNYLHDLESQWWAAMWILLCHTDEESPPENLIPQLVQYSRVFPSIVCQNSRIPFFTYPHTGWDTLSASYKDQCIPVFDFANSLRGTYFRAEKSLPVIELPDTLLDSIHEKASDAYRRTKEQLQTSNIRLQTLHNALKRRNSGDLFTG